MLPPYVHQRLSGKEIRDYGINICPGEFIPQVHYATLPSSLVLAFALAVVSRGNARRIYLAGFDGYGPGDPRTTEVKNLLSTYLDSTNSPPTFSITPTEYSITTLSIYSPTLD